MDCFEITLQKPGSMSEEINAIESASRDLPERRKTNLKIIGAILFIIAAASVFVAKEWPEKKQPNSPTNNSQQQIIQISDSGKPGNIKAVQQNSTTGANTYNDNSTNAPVNKTVNNHYTTRKKVQRHFTDKEIRQIIDSIPTKGYPILITINGRNQEDMKETDSLGSELKRKLTSRGYFNIGTRRITQNNGPNTLVKFEIAKATEDALDPNLDFPKIILVIWWQGDY